MADIAAMHRQLLDVEQVIPFASIIARRLHLDEATVKQELEGMILFLRNPRHYNSHVWLYRVQSPRRYNSHVLLYRKLMSEALSAISEAARYRRGAQVWNYNA